MEEKFLTFPTKRLYEEVFEDIEIGMVYISTQRSDVDLACQLNQLLSINLMRIRSDSDLKRINNQHLPQLALYYSTTDERDEHDLNNPNEYFLLVNKVNTSKNNPPQRQQMQLFEDFDLQQNKIEPPTNQITKLLANRTDFLLILLGYEAIDRMYRQYEQFVTLDRLKASPICDITQFVDAIPAIQYAIETLESQSLEQKNKEQQLNWDINDNNKKNQNPIRRVQEYLKQQQEYTQ